MSWTTDINDKIFEIVTGDGKSYFPKWRNATKSQEFNVSVYEFIKTPGSFVDRKEAKGRKFDLEFYFDGDTAVDQGNNFEISSRDKRKWLLKHPFYGDIYCQPTTFFQDNSIYNVSKFTVTVIETLPEGYPSFNSSFVDIIAETQQTINDAQIANFENKNLVDKGALKSLTEKFDAIFSKIMDQDSDLNQFKALVNNTVNEIASATASATSILRAFIDLVNYPATISQTVKQRFNAFNEALNELILNITGIIPDSRTNTLKTQFEAIGGSILAAQQIASTTNFSDNNSYLTKNNVLDQQDQIIESYNSFIAIIEENQTDRNDSTDSYSPDFDSMNELSNIITLSISNLYLIAFDAKQERSYITETETNAILLTHRFYGIDREDKNLEYFINTNELSFDEILLINKGRKVLFYI